MKVNADEGGNGGEESADRVPYLLATKPAHRYSSKTPQPMTLNPQPWTINRLGGDAAADPLRYPVATKSRTVAQRKLKRLQGSRRIWLPLSEAG